MKSKTGIIWDPDTLLHQCGRMHPERPQRVKHAITQLNQNNIIANKNIDFVQKIIPIQQQLIQACHSKEYISHIQNLWPEGLQKDHVLVLDTYFSKHSRKAADLAAGGVITSIDNIMQKKWMNAFALVRPPGHHSGFRNVINGFCVYNNVAIGAKYLQNKYGLKKILIFDWDVHHGDGTQHIFNDNPDILFISLHRYDYGSFHPGESGSYLNVGKNKAEGKQINISWNTCNQQFEQYNEKPGDNEYIYVFQRILSPIIKQFNPQFIFISAGFDSARGDPLGGLNVSPDCYYYLTTQLMNINGNVLVVLQGGYNIQSIANSVQGVMYSLLKQSLPNPQSSLSQQQKKLGCFLRPQYHNNIQIIVNFLSKYWNILNCQELTQYEQNIRNNSKRIFGKYYKDNNSIIPNFSLEVENLKVKQRTIKQI